MSNLKLAAEQALEFCEFLWREVLLNDWAEAQREAVEQALRAALSSPEQEPVAWLSEGGDVSRSKRYMDEMGFKCEPLYTAPAPRKPLTDEEIDGLRLTTGYAAGLERFTVIARAIERAHGITGDSNE